MTPEIAELRAKARWHRKEAAAIMQKLSTMDGYNPCGTPPACIVEINGVSVGVSDLQFSIMEILIRDEAQGCVSSRDEIATKIGGNYDVLRSRLVDLRKRLKRAGVTIESIGHSGLRLNVIKSSV